MSGMDIGNGVDRTSVFIGTAVKDSIEDGTVEVHVSGINFYTANNSMNSQERIIISYDGSIGDITPKHLLNLSDIEENIEKEDVIEKINIKSNIETAEDRLNAIFED